MRNLAAIPSLPIKLSKQNWCDFWAYQKNTPLIKLAQMARTILADEASVTLDYQSLIFSKYSKFDLAFRRCEGGKMYP